jgi:hypothetical protein
MQALELVAPLTPLVVAPLGFLGGGGRRISLPMVFACALPAAGSFALDYGTLAMLLTLPWLVFTAVEAWNLRGLWWRDPAMAGSRLYLFAGSVMLSLSRVGFGAEPLGMSDERLLLASIHCWYAGFAAACFARLTRRAAGRDSVLHRVSLTGILCGAAWLVMGTFGVPVMEHIGGGVLILAMVIQCAMALLATGTVRHASGWRLLAGRLLISVCGAAVVAGLSATAWLVVRGLQDGVASQIPIPQLANMHGSATALGLTAGLLGWVLLADPSRDAAGGLLGDAAGLTAQRKE